MDRLWTPWRMAFIEGASTRDETAPEPCFLCTKPGAEAGRDRENLVLFRSNQAFVVLNLYPYNPGHLMVAPYAHTGDYGALAADVASEIAEVTQLCVRSLGTAYRPDAFNVGMNLGRAAGAGVPNHLHVHVVPRWNGDTNFMPIVGEVKVLPEALETTYDRLHPLFYAEAKA